MRYIRTAVVALATSSLFVAASTPAHALLDPFSVTPTSGAAGSEVTVRGTGCSPGLTNTSADYVMVTATNPVVSLKLSVTNTGAWSGTFTIPTGTLPIVAAITAACFTNGLPSIVATYAPQTFTVTAAPAPTTTTPTTSGVSPATTVPAVISPGPETSPGNGGTAHTTLPGNDTSDPNTGGGGGGTATPVTNPDGTPSNGGSSDGSTRASDSHVTTSKETTNGAHESATPDAEVARAATDFTVPKKTDDFTWLLWMLVVLGLFIAGAVAMGLRWRHEECADEPAS